MTTERPIAARLGLVALSALWPGLGLVRIGDVRRGLILLASVPVLLLLLAAGAWIAPPPDYPSFRTWVAVAAAVLAGITLYSVVATWRASRVREPVRPAWSRWSAVAALSLATYAASLGSTTLMRSSVRLFYTPTESMVPTLLVDDRLLVDMRDRGPPRRGELVLVSVRDTVWIMRVVAVGGDRIAVRGGVPVIDGVAARQVVRGWVDTGGIFGIDVMRARRLAETLPGATSRYEIADKDVLPTDEMAEVVVPRGRMFLMGDNRDNSLDSRFDTALGGVGMPPVGAIIGRPRFVVASGERSRVGVRLDAGVEPPPRTR